MSLARGKGAGGKSGGSKTGGKTGKAKGYGASNSDEVIAVLPQSHDCILQAAREAMVACIRESMACSPGSSSLVATAANLLSMGEGEAKEHLAQSLADSKLEEAVRLGLV